VRYGIYVPSYGTYASARELVDLAERAEVSGWDGFFMYDVVTVGGLPVADPQITLAAVAASTEKLIFGPLVTPLARRRPWKVAREIATLAELSGGRVVLGCSVGSGLDFAPFPGEVRTAAERVARFTDAVELIRQMLSGSAIEWTRSERSARVLGGQDATLSLDPFLPAPSTPVPIWGGATVQREAEQRLSPFKRAARILDGLFPLAEPMLNDMPITLEEFVRAVDYAFEGGKPPDGFDLIATGRSGVTAKATPSDPARFAAEGATWWLEFCPTDALSAEIRPLIEAGPPLA
jgi:alkanesulfonate monooxygenase SsuD/methylene tetrahydromethanopterin reductase-like flavin-dependent oxidoreductase (luciferase family)